MAKPKTKPEPEQAPVAPVATVRVRANEPLSEPAGIDRAKGEEFEITAARAAALGGLITLL